MRSARSAERVVALVLLVAVLAGCGGGEEQAGCTAPAAAEPAWHAAASTLRMPVYRITDAPALTLTSVLAKRGCGSDDTEQVEATYRGPGGDLVRLYQGRPYGCGNLGDVRRLGAARVRGREAVFYESPNSDNQGGMFLVWHTAPRTEPTRGLGSEMLLEVRGTDKARALRIARSLRLVRPVDRRPADALDRVVRIYGPYARARTSTPLLGNCFFVPATGRPCAGPAGDYVTPELGTALERYANEGTGADPIVCAQNIPFTITYDVREVTASTATFVVHADFAASNDHPVMVTVDLGSLRLTGVRC